MTNLRGTRLSTQEVADLLGVRLETVYAYVSRGLLSSTRAAGGRGSTFDRAEVEALAGSGGRRRAAPQRTWRGPVVDTDITLIDGGRLYLRGVDAVQLAAAVGFEPAAQWLWTGDLEPAAFTPAPEPLAAARAAVDALPPSADLVGRLRVAVAAAGSVDPLRYDVRERAVLPAAQGLLATMVEALPVVGVQPDDGAPLTRRLWARLSPQPPTDRLLGCLDAALVLLMDHDLAVSTVAARTAASVRAHPYAVVATGLAAMEGPLHGGASTLARELLRGAHERDPRLVVADHLRTGRPLPGFGHPLYPDGDPRGRALLDRLADEPVADEVMDVVRGLVEASDLHPNVDLALAALGESTGMTRDGGEVVFCVARSVGWVAHALEEYDETPLRFRGEGRYRGPRPPQPVPTPTGD
ncbi:citrate synthase family protein [Angustibacter sp. McL0619]|uniref:citrate synthase family protein n=1 Tax=Angustibacter sp. McL0619 TaxID=3415676 RepID=UPI003CF49D63